MQGRLLMMPSSSQVLDHQLIFHIMYVLGQFHHRQNKGEERRGEIWQKKSNSCLTNIERKRCKKQLLLSKHRGQELTATTWLEDPYRSKSGNLHVVNNGLEQRSNSRQSNSRGVEQRRSREVQQPVVKSSSQQLGKRVEQQPASRSRSRSSQQYSSSSSSCIYKQLYPK